MDDDLVWEIIEGGILAQVCLNDILKRGADEKVLLPQTKLFSLYVVVGRV